MNHTLYSYKCLACFPIKVFMCVSSHPRMIYRMSCLSPYNLTSGPSPESVRWRRLTAIYASVRIINFARDGWPHCSGATWPKNSNHKRQTKQILTSGTNILYRNQMRCPACGVFPKAIIWFPNKPTIGVPSSDCTIIFISSMLNSFFSLGFYIIGNYAVPHTTDTYIGTEPHSSHIHRWCKARWGFKSPWKHRIIYHAHLRSYGMNSSHCYSCTEAGIT